MNKGHSGLLFIAFALTLCATPPELVEGGVAYFSLLTSHFSLRLPSPKIYECYYDLFPATTQTVC